MGLCVFLCESLGRSTCLSEFHIPVLERVTEAVLIQEERLSHGAYELYSLLLPSSAHFTLDYCWMCTVRSQENLWKLLRPPDSVFFPHAFDSVVVEESSPLQT